jgi:hypothetical protein
MSRRLEALRNLAERPGTEHEGIVARAMLKRAEAKAPDLARDYLENVRAFGRGDITFSEYLNRTQQTSPAMWSCPCGDTIYMNGKCLNQFRHLEIQTRIRAVFSRGDRVFYNFHAYPRNCPGKIAAHVKLQQDNGTYPWAWVSVKFDHLKSARQIPVLNEKGEWCLTKEALT